MKTNVDKSLLKLRNFTRREILRVPLETALSVLSSASLFLIASSGSTDRFSLLADEEMGIFVLGGPLVAGF